LRRHQKNCRTKKGEHGRSAGPFPKAQVPEDGIPERTMDRLHPSWFQPRQEQQSLAAENARQWQQGEGRPGPKQAWRAPTFVATFPSAPTTANHCQREKTGGGAPKQLMQSPNPQDVVSVLRYDKAGANQRNDSGEKTSRAQTSATLGAIIPICLRKYPAKGSINNPVSVNPQAASR